MFGEKSWILNNQLEMVGRVQREATRLAADTTTLPGSLFQWLTAGHADGLEVNV